MIEQITGWMLVNSGSGHPLKTKEISEIAEWFDHFWTRSLMDVLPSGAVLFMLLVVGLCLCAFWAGKRPVKLHDKFIVSVVLLLVVIQLLCRGFYFVGIALTLLLVILVWHIWLRWKTIRQPKPIDIKSVFLRFLLVWIAGFLVYFVGFFVEGTKESVLAFGLRPALSSLELFVSHSDLLEVADNMKEDQWYMLAFTCVYFSAIYTSLSFFLELVSYRIHAFRRIHLARKRLCETLYLFVNVNDHVEEMAHSIYQQHEAEGKLKDIRMLFLENDHADGGGIKRLNLMSIIGSFVHRKDIYDLMYRYDGLVSFYNGDFANQPPEDSANQSSESKESFFEKYDMVRVSKLIKKAEHVKLFFFSDDAGQNIRDAKAFMAGVDELKLDRKEEGSKKKDIEYYVIAPRDSYTDILEMDFDHPMRIVDPSHIAVSILQNNVRYQPVSFVEIEPDCTVSSEFNALLVGFGEIGKNALSYLYEFGAFADAKQTEKRSPFHCTVFDKNMKANKGLFEMQVPAVRNNPLISFHDSDVCSDGFWNWFAQKEPGDGHTHAERLNYVVVAMGDDDTNISIATEIYKLFVRMRKNDLQRLKIFVSSYKRENIKKLERIAAFYNEKNKESKGEMVIFGKSGDIFTYDRLVDHQIYEDAKGYYKKYNELNKDKKTWEERHNEATNYKKIKDTMRKEMQDIANVQHIKTKLMLYGGAKEWAWTYDRRSEANATDVEKRAFDDVKKQLRSVASTICLSIEKEKARRNSLDTELAYFDLEDATKQQISLNKKMLQLARTEHLRWIAAHEMLGYVEGEEKDVLGQTHCCLVPWSKLNSVSEKEGCYKKGKDGKIQNYPDYELYDYIVVETTFVLSDERVNNKNSAAANRQV